MTTQRRLNPKVRSIGQFPMIAVFDHDGGVVHEDAKGGLHKRASLLHCGVHHHLVQSWDKLFSNQK